MRRQDHRPLRGNGIPYQGINVLMLWGAAMEKGYSAIWMTFKQALNLAGAVRKGEHGSLVVYASTFSRKRPTRRPGKVGADIPFLKGYTVFNVEQIDGLPAQSRTGAPRIDPVQRIDHAERFFAATGATVRHGGDGSSPGPDHVQMPHFEAFRDAESYYAILAMNSPTGPPTRHGWRGNSDASGLAMKVMPWRNSLPNWRGLPLRRS